MEDDGDDNGEPTATREADDDSDVVAGLESDDSDVIAAREPGDGDDDGDGRSGLAAALDSSDGGAPGGGALAMLDAELDPGDVVASGDAVYAEGTAGAAEQYEQSLRHHRPSAWGRLDVGVSWRLRQSEPMHAPAHRASELWLVATWRR